MSKRTFNGYRHSVTAASLTLFLLSGAEAPVHAEAVGWKSATVKKTLLDSSANPRNIALATAVSATRSGCKVAKVEGNVLDGFAVRLNGQLGARYDEIAKETPLFSDDGSSMAFAARRGGDWFWVINGTEQAPYPELTPTSFAFSGNGRHHAYVAIPRFRQSVLVVDGKVGKTGTWTDIMAWDAAPVFSADGSRLAFVESNRTARKMRVHLDGEAGPWNDGVAMATSPGFGPFIAPDDVLAQVSQERARPGIFNMCFSPNGKRFAFGCFKSGRTIMTVDGQEIQEHDALGFDSVFNFDGSRHAYMAEDGGRHFICVSGSSPMPVEVVYDWSLTYSPDGKHFAFSGIRDGKKAIWLDGKPAPCDVPISECLNSTAIVFSPDSQRLAFCIRSDQALHWIVDGKAGPALRHGTGVFSFSPDSRHHACVGADSPTSNSQLFIDGEVRATYRAIACGPVFRSDGVLEFLATEGNSLFRFEVIGY